MESKLKYGFFVLSLLFLLYYFIDRIPSNFLETQGTHTEKRIHIQTNTNTETNKVATNNIVDIVIKKHKACFSNELFTTLNHKNMSTSAKYKALNFTEVCRYALLGRNVSKSIRYNHFCPWMKPRYNCAHNKSKIEYGQEATDWKLVLSKGEDNECNLWEFINDLGGPSGIAQQMLLDATNMHSELARTNNRSINILMIGNSYLRQMFQALKCGWSSDMTLSLMQRNALYGVSFAAMRKRHGKKIKLSEIGSMERMPFSWEGNPCKQEMHAEFYRSDVDVPTSCDFNELFDDNISVIEFGGLIRFYFIFRPDMYQDLDAIIRDKLLLNPNDIDIVVNNRYRVKNSKIIDILKERRVWFDWPYGKFKEIQYRDINRWFGADNPWIYKVPDGHACMPGPPDDEVNLLLFALYSNAVMPLNE